MNLVIYAILGLVTGHLVRRLTPYLVDWDDKSLPFKFPGVELAAALAFVLLALERGYDIDQWKWLVLTLFLLSVASTDHLCKYINIKICLVGLGLGILFSAIWPADILALFNQQRFLSKLAIDPDQPLLGGIVLSLVGAAMGWAQLEFIRRVFRPLVGMDVMGEGDGFLMLMVGAFLGPQAIFFALLPACLIGIAIGAVWKILFGTPHFPFGPSLSLGALIILLYGDWIIAGVAGFQNGLNNLEPMVLLGFSTGLVIVLVWLLVRLKNKAAEYEEAIEEDYKKIDEKIKK